MSEDKQPGKDERGRFTSGNPWAIQRGQVLNPKGRPPSAKGILRPLRFLLERKPEDLFYTDENGKIFLKDEMSPETTGAMIAIRLIEAAIASPTWTTRVAAIRDIIDRVDGKAPASEPETEPEEPLKVEIHHVRRTPPEVGSGEEPDA